MKEIKLTTTDLQLTVIALICHDSHVLKDKEPEVERLIDTFAELNRLCEPSNDYTLTLTVNN